MVLGHSVRACCSPAMHAPSFCARPTPQVSEGTVFNVPESVSESRIAEVVRQGEFKVVASANKTYIRFLGGRQVCPPAASLE